MDDSLRREMPSGVNIAHRGASAYAPEHTGAAFEQAIAMAADYLELDIRQTRDGRLINLHDETLRRTTDVEARYPDRAPFRVYDFTLAEIKTLDAGGWFGAEFAGLRLLTLEDIFALI